MKKIIILSIIMILNFNPSAFADKANCKEFKKFSVEYFKCKGKNIIIDTKNYQKKEWSEEKDKMLKKKDKVKKLKKKVLN